MNFRGILTGLLALALVAPASSRMGCAVCGSDLMARVRDLTPLASDHPNPANPWSHADITEDALSRQLLISPPPPSPPRRRQGGAALELHELNQRSQHALGTLLSSPLNLGGEVTAKSATRDPQPENTPQPATPDPRPDIDPKHKKELDDDVALGKEVAANVDKEMKKSTSQQFIDRVQRIGNDLARIANETKVDVLWGDRRMSNFNYTFTVLEGDDVNAFSLPGGFIYVYEGLIKYCETDHELAGVMAHEIAHASLRHIATLRREQSKLEAITLPLIIISLLSGGESGTSLAAAGSLVNQAIGSGWSVKAERAADHAGLQYMLKSGYNPVGAITFLERLAYDDRTKAQPDWGIYRTHPPNRERSTALSRQIAALGVPLKRSIVSTTYRAIQIEEVDGSQSIKFGGRKLITFSGDEAAVRAQKAATALNNFADAVPRLYEVEAGEDGTILGQGRILFRILESDAEVVKLPVQEVIAETLKNLKAAMYDLNYRISGI